MFLLKQKLEAFFHFGQCIWRKIQTISDICEKYISDAYFALNIKQLMALAFIPVRAESSMPLTSAPKVVMWTVFLLEYRELEFIYTLIAPDEEGIAYACLELRIV